LKIKTSNGKASQKWYFDWRSRTIKNRLNNQAITISNSGSGSNLRYYSANSYWYQIWRYDGKFFFNVYNKKVFDVKGGKDEEGNDVYAWKKHGGRNQQWRVIYEDKIVKHKTGKYFRNFGMRAYKKFYFVSKLPTARVLESVGAYKMVIKKYVKNRLSQQWYFDPVTKTVTSV